MPVVAKVSASVRIHLRDGGNSAVVSLDVDVPGELASLDAAPEALSKAIGKKLAFMVAAKAPEPIATAAVQPLASDQRIQAQAAAVAPLSIPEISGDAAKAAKEIVEGVRSKRKGQRSE